jgi:hypothetical protein
VRPRHTFHSAEIADDRQDVDVRTDRCSPLGQLRDDATTTADQVSAAISPISTDGAWAWPQTVLGITEASATRIFSSPRTHPQLRIHHARTIAAHQVAAWTRWHPDLLYYRALVTCEPLDGECPDQLVDGLLARIRLGRG